MDQKDSSTQNTFNDSAAVKRGVSWLFWLVAVVLIVIIAGGVYLWQHNQVNSLEKQLNGSSAAAGEGVSPSQGTFVYKSTVGKMTLTLPKTYAIIELAISSANLPKNIRLTSFSVASIKSANVLTQNNLQNIQISVSSNFTANSLSQVVSSTESSMKSDDTNVTATSVQVAGLPAQEITATNKTAGNLAVYLVSSGGYLYTISVNGLQNGQLPSVAQTVFKDMKIS